MTRITPYDVKAVTSKLGLQLRERDDELSGRCPMHKARMGRVDRSPSWSINLDSGLHHCFSCGYKGNIVTLVSDVRGLDYFDAARWIRSLGFDFEKLLTPLKKERKLKTEFTESELAIFGWPPKTSCVSVKVRMESVKKYGVLWCSVPDRRGWVFPIRQANGQCIGYQLKTAGYFRNKPINVEKSKTLFGIQHLPIGETAVLLESPLDVVVLDSMHIKGYYGVASWGAAVSDVQMHLLLEHTDKIVVALDDDSAGHVASRMIRDAYSSRCVMRFFSYPEESKGKKDIGELNRADVVSGLKEAVHSVFYR